MRLLSLVASCALSVVAGAPGVVTKAPPAVFAYASERVEKTDKADSGQKSAADRAKKPMGYVLGRSVGSPTDGKLVGGSHLDDAPYLRVVPAYSGEDVRWGLGSLVGLIDRAARSVRRQFPDAVLSTGHLSRHGGGELDRHASHESGRDADIGFYVKSQTGKPLYAEHFVPFKGDGTAPSWPGAYFDDARNWALVSAIASDPLTHVTHIFVAIPLRARLLSYAERTGAPPAVRQHAAELMAQPRGALPHDDHFHVRIGCPNGMSGCVENPTLPLGLHREALANKMRLARAAPAHGRAHASHAAPASSPASPPGPSPSPAPREPREHVAPVAPPPSPPPSVAPDPERAVEGPSNEVPALMIDDVDGVMDAEPARPERP